MVDKKIDELFKLMTSPLVTPFNLLENISLDNYVSINYHKDNSSILADIVFLSHNEEITYRYVFDMNYHLQNIYEVDNDKLIERFNREDTVNDLYSQLRSCTNRDVVSK